MDAEQLMKTAKALVPEGKGLLAADESFPSIEKRFKTINLDSTEENRRAYRELLFDTKGMEEFISGVILFDETLRQSHQNGTPFPKFLENLGIIPGIKVDTGAKDMAGFPGEKITNGLDGLRDRLKEYYDKGARFAKWRSVITIGPGIPTRGCIQGNAFGLARYAALCQEANLVPIIEPEVLMDADNTIGRCEEVTEETLSEAFYQVRQHGVLLEGLILKCNMVVSGKKCSDQASVSEVAEATVRCLRRTVPTAIPGIVFLSGGQSPQAATEHLNAINSLGPHPWAITFSYGRALQEPALSVWKGQTGNLDTAKQNFFVRAKLNGLAQLGTYKPDMEPKATA